MHIFYNPYVYIKDIYLFSSPNIYLCKIRLPEIIEKLCWKKCQQEILFRTQKDLTNFLVPPFHFTNENITVGNG